MTDCNNMNVLIITAVYPPEPVVSANLSADLYHKLSSDGHGVTVVHPKATRPNGFNFGDSVVCVEDEVITDSFVCPQMSLLGRIRESRSFGSACAAYIRDHHDEINCIYANAWPMFSQMAIVRAAKKYGIPSIIHVQDVYPESLTNKMPTAIGSMVNAIILPMDKYILRNCSRVVAISDKMKNYLAESRAIDKDKISVVVNWQNEKEFLDYQEGSSNCSEGLPFTFMYMGNIGPVAGVDLLIDAFMQAKLECARLVIAGSGSMKEQLMAKAANCGAIEFWDVPNGKVPEIQSKADVMMLPIKKGAASSSIPSKLPAYMFSAKPIIGCVDEDSDTANAINEADCGWVIEPENVEKLADTMKMVAGINRTTLEDKAKKAQEYGLAHFSKKENLNRLVKVIEEIL